MSLKKVNKASVAKSNPNWSLIAGITVGIGSMIYLAKKLQYKKHESIPCAPNFQSYSGHALWFLSNYDKIHDKIKEIALENSKTDDLISFTLPDFHAILPLKPKIIEWIFTLEFDKFWKSPYVLERFEVIFGKYGQGIFVADGKQWRFHRKIGSRMFSLRNVKNYMYNCCIDTTKSTLNVLETLHKNGKIIDINDIFGRMTFDCFTSIAFGIEFNSMSLYPKPHPFGKAFDRAMKEILKRNMDPLWKVKKLLNIGYEKILSEDVKVIHKFSDDVVRQRTKAISNFKDENNKTFDLFSLYKRHNPELSDEDMKYIALNFIIAGRDTTRMLLSWFMYDLTQFNNVKNKVLNEINSVKDITYENILNMKYLEAALCESLRYHPVVPVSIRSAKQDIKIPKNICNGKEYIIKKGDRIEIHHPTISRSTYFWKNPDKYDPERFMEKGVRTYPHYIYGFFNQNPRLCLGRDFALMEAKIFLVSFFKKYDFKSVENQEVIYEPGIILNMKNGFKINLIPK